MSHVFGPKDPSKLEMYFKKMHLALVTPFSFKDLYDSICGLDSSTCLGDGGLTRDSFLGIEMYHMYTYYAKLLKYLFLLHYAKAFLLSLISLMPEGGDSTTSSLAPCYSLFYSL